MLYDFLRQYRLYVYVSFSLGPNVYFYEPVKKINFSCVLATHVFGYVANTIESIISYRKLHELKNSKWEWKFAQVLFLLRKYSLYN